MNKKYYCMAKINILVPFPKCVLDINYLIFDESSRRVMKKSVTLDDITKVSIDDVNNYILEYFSSAFEDDNATIKNINISDSDINEVQKSLSNISFRFQDGSRQTLFSMVFSHSLFYRLDIEYEENNITNDNKLLDTKLNICKMNQSTQCKQLQEVRANK